MLNKTSMRPDSNSIDYFHEAELEATTSEEELENVFFYEPAGEVEERPSAREEPLSPNQSPELPVAEWMQRALANLQAERNDEATFEVLRRSLETASRFQAADLSDDTDAAGIEAFVQAVQASLKTDTPILPMPKEGWPVELGVKTTQALDADVFEVTEKIQGGVPRAIELEYVALERFSSICVGYGILLYKYFGQEVLDLSYELIKFGSSWGINHLNNESFFQKAVAQVGNEEDKKGIVEAAVQFYRLDPGRELVLIAALSIEGIDRMKPLERDTEEVMGEIKERFLKEPKFRIGLLSGIQRLVRMPDTSMIRAFTRRGLLTLMEEAGEVTDHEWWGRLKQQWNEIEALSGKERKAFLDDEKLEHKHRDFKDEIDDFFEKHPEAPQARKLAEVIGCDSLREELLKIRMEHNSSRVRMKIQEIIMRILTEVSRYRYRTAYASEKNAPPTWQLGLPLYVTREKKMSCFSGPWLTAALLMKCGILYDDLAYCHVYESHEGIIGGHGALLLNDRTDYFLIDPNYDPECYELPYRIFQSMDPKISIKIMELFAGTRKRPVKLKLPSVSEVPELGMLKIHPRMAIIPLADGLMSGHMLNVGISFLLEGKLDEAQIAFEFGLTAFSDDPDIYYHLGITHMKKGEDENAEHYFRRALAIFPKHLKSQFGLGELAMRRGNILAAKIAFSPVHFHRDIIWRGDSFHKAATRTLETPSWRLEEMGFDGWRKFLTEPPK